MPEETLAKLGDELKQEIGRVLPVTIKEVMLAEGIGLSNENGGNLLSLQGAWSQLSGHRGGFQYRAGISSLALLGVDDA